MEEYSPTEVTVTCPVCGEKRTTMYSTRYSFSRVEKMGFMSKCRKCSCAGGGLAAGRKASSRNVFDFHGCRVRATIRTVLVDGFRMARCREYITCRYGSYDESAESCLELAVRYGMDGWRIEKRGDACGG